MESYTRVSSSFVWDKVSLPLANEFWLAAAPAGYVCAVLALRFALGGRTVPLGPLPILHNLVLVLWRAPTSIWSPMKIRGLALRAGCRCYTLLPRPRGELD